MSFVAVLVWELVNQAMALWVAIVSVWESIKCWLTGSNIGFSILPLVLYTKVLQHTQQSTKSTEKEKEQSEYANNKARSKAALVFGFADFCLMHVMNNHRLLTN